MILSTRNSFYDRMKFLELRGIPRKNIVDGCVFKIPHFNFPRLLAEGIAYGILEENRLDDVALTNCTIYPRFYRIANNMSVIKLGRKSYIGNSCTDGSGIIHIENFTCISWQETFEFGLNLDHNHRNVNSYGLGHFDWFAPQNFFPPQGICRINIGNDVWIGRGCILKCSNPEKPLIIGDGAVVASDSVVVKNVPPYAIVGGNPAQIIKYRFPEKIIESLLRIKWWDWDLDKIHENFKYFNDVEKFVELHDKGV